MSDLPESQEGTLAYRTTTTPSGGYDWTAPPPNSISLGDGHAYTKLWAGEPETSVWLGIDEWHRKADGAWCVGYCLFRCPEADEWAATYVGRTPTRWDTTREPLTMSPSIACKVCPSHGYIREGRWVAA